MPGSSKPEPMPEGENVLQVVPGRGDSTTEALARLFQEKPALAARWLSLLGLGEGEWAAGSSRKAVELVARGRRVLVTDDPRPLDIERADAVVLLTAGDEGWPEHLEELGRWHRVRLLRARWSDLGRLAESSGGTPGRKFAAGLVDEGLLPAVAVGAHDWADFVQSTPTLTALLREVLAELAADSSAQPQVYEHESSVYGRVTVGRELIGVGFARDSKALGTHLEFTPSYVALEPLVYTFVHAPAKPGSMVARMALAEAGGIGAAWGTHPVVARPVPHVVFAEDFTGQAEQLVRFAREIVERYRAQGYLSGS